MATLSLDEESLKILKLSQTATDDEIFKKYLKLAFTCLSKNGSCDLNGSNMKEFLMLTLAYCTLIPEDSAQVDEEFMNSDFVHLKEIFAHLTIFDYCGEDFYNMTMKYIFNLFWASQNDPVVSTILKFQYTTHTTHKNPDRVSRTYGNKKQMQKQWRKEGYALQDRHPDPNPVRAEVKKTEPPQLTEKEREKEEKKQKKKARQREEREERKKAKEREEEKIVEVVPKPSKEEAIAATKQLKKETEESLAKHKEQKKREKEKEEKRKEKEEQQRREMERQAPEFSSLAPSGRSRRKAKNSVPAPSITVNKKAKATQPSSKAEAKFSTPKNQKAKKNQPMMMENISFNPFDESGVVDDWGDIRAPSRPGPAFQPSNAPPPQMAQYALPKKTSDDGFIPVVGKRLKSSSKGNNMPLPPPNVWAQRQVEQTHKFPTSQEEEDEMLNAVLAMSKQEAAAPTLWGQNDLTTAPCTPIQLPLSAGRREEYFRDDLFRPPPSGTGLDDFLPVETANQGTSGGGALSLLSQEWTTKRPQPTWDKIKPLGVDAPSLGALVALDRSVCRKPSDPLKIGSVAFASSALPSFPPSDLSSEDEQEILPPQRPPTDQLFAPKNTSNDDDDWELEDDIDEELEKQQLAANALQISLPPPTSIDPLQQAMASMGFSALPAPRQPSQPGHVEQKPVPRFDFSEWVKTVTPAAYHTPDIPHPDPTAAYEPLAFDEPEKSEARHSSRHRPPGLAPWEEEMNATVNAVRGGASTRSTFQI